MSQFNPGEISGSHGGEYEDDCLLGSCLVIRPLLSGLIALMM
jgi:hypothetical protein